MKRIKSLLVAVVAGLAAGSLSASAEAGIVVFDLNFSTASGGTYTDLTGVAELFTNAGTVVGYKDNDGSGGINAGDTFRAYSVVKITGYADADGNTIFDPNAGKQEITIATVYEGVQLSAGLFTITSVKSLDVYYDYKPTTGGAFTISDYKDLKTFVDGTLVEKGAFVRSTPTSLPIGPNGSGGVALDTFLTDQLHLAHPGETFEFGTGGTGGPLSFFANFDANTQLVPNANFSGGLNGGDTIQPGATAFTIAAGGGYADIFSAYGLTGTQTVSPTSGAAITALSDTDNGAYNFAFTVRSDGSIIKVNLRPEPGSIIVWSLAAMSLAVPALRRRKKAIEA